MISEFGVGEEKILDISLVNIDWFCDSLVVLVIFFNCAGLARRASLNICQASFVIQFVSKQVTLTLLIKVLYVHTNKYSTTESNLGQTFA